MTITPESRAALHTLLDISLDTPHSTADVMFSVSAHCDVVHVNIHPGGWKTNTIAAKQFWISPEMNTEGAEKALAETLLYMSTDNSVAIAAERKRLHLERLRSELEAAQKEGV